MTALERRKFRAKVRRLAAEAGVPYYTPESETAIAEFIRTHDVPRERLAELRVFAEWASVALRMGITVAELQEALHAQP